jgi:putative phosphoesterase
MKIGIIADIHENFHNLILALEEMDRSGVEQIICLGDLMNDGIAKVLALSSIPVFTIWGNNDGDKVAITKTAMKDGSNLTVHDRTYHFMNVDNRIIFITHYDDLATTVATSGLYDAVFYGHTHLPKTEKINNTLVVNPGELAAQKTGNATFAVYDTKSNDTTVFTLDHAISLKTAMVDEFFRKHKKELVFRSDFKL